MMKKILCALVMLAISSCAIVAPAKMEGVVISEPYLLESRVAVSMSK